MKRARLRWARSTVRVRAYGVKSERLATATERERRIRTVYSTYGVREEQEACAEN